MTTVVSPAPTGPGDCNSESPVSMLPVLSIMIMVDQVGNQVENGMETVITLWLRSIINAVLTPKDTLLCPPNEV